MKSLMTQRNRIGALDLKREKRANFCSDSLKKFYHIRSLGELFESCVKG